MATEALNGHIAFMLADGEEIPDPSTLEIILRDINHQDAHSLCEIPAGSLL